MIPKKFSTSVFQHLKKKGQPPIKQVSLFNDATDKTPPLLTLFNVFMPLKTKSHPHDNHKLNQHYKVKPMPITQPW